MPESTEFGKYIEMLKQLREWTKLPVIILSVRDADQEKVAARDAGADDYLTKPFRTEELMARLWVALHHVQPATVFVMPICRCLGCT